MTLYRGDGRNEARGDTAGLAGRWAAPRAHVLPRVTWAPRVSSSATQPGPLAFPGHPALSSRWCTSLRGAELAPWARGPPSQGPPHWPGGWAVPARGALSSSGFSSSAFTFCRRTAALPSSPGLAATVLCDACLVWPLPEPGATRIFKSISTRGHGFGSRASTWHSGKLPPPGRTDPTASRAGLLGEGWEHDRQGLAPAPAQGALRPLPLSPCYVEIQRHGPSHVPTNLPWLFPTGRLSQGPWVTVPALFHPLSHRACSRHSPALHQTFRVNMG